jgi:eukaryotic-like serine/threonine-protein kinase
LTPAPKRQPIPFGKYLLLDRANIGGMAEVWRAKTFGSGGFERLVAIKRILPSIAEDEEFISMFIDEAKITVQLNHANIAQIYELSHISNSYFIAMEYVSGKDMRALFDRCRKRGEPAPIPLVCYLLASCCDGLDYAHRAKDQQGRDMNIVHRDVSPQNVLISYDGEVKVIDFGIAKAAGKATKTQAGILKGKFGYMSPEQIRGLTLDRRSDVFALGICLFEMLTGERLFVGDSDFSVLEKVRKVEMLPPSHYNKKVSPELEALVMKALARDVENRYQYASDLGEDLRKFLYAQAGGFGRKDLAAFIRATFAEDLEKEKQRLAEYSRMSAVNEAVENVSTPAAKPALELVTTLPHPMPVAAPAPVLTSRPSAVAVAPPVFASTEMLKPLGDIPKLTAAAAVPTVPPPDFAKTAVMREGADPAASTGEDESDNATLFIPPASGVVEVPLPGAADQPRLPSLYSPFEDQPVTQLDTARERQLRDNETLPPAAQNRPSVDAEHPTPLPELSNETPAPDLMAVVPTVVPVNPPGAQAPVAKRPTANIAAAQIALSKRSANPEDASRRLLMIAIAVVGVIVLGIWTYVFMSHRETTGILYLDPGAEVGGKARVEFNGKPILEADGSPIKDFPTIREVSAGTGTLLISAPGYKPVLETIEIKPGHEYSAHKQRLTKE